MTFTSRGVLVRWNHLDGMQEELDFPPADTSFDILDGNTDISSALTGVEWSKVSFFTYRTLFLLEKPFRLSLLQCRALSFDRICPHFNNL